MKYNLSIPSELADFEYRVKYLTLNKKKVELKAIKETRTTRQNSSLHLYFTFISNELNELGIEFQYLGLRGQTLETRYTPDIVKTHIWKPIQKTLFDIESTTELNTSQINEIIDVITKFFGEKGVVIPFPSIESLIDKE